MVGAPPPFLSEAGAVTSRNATLFGSQPTARTARVSARTARTARTARVGSARQSARTPHLDRQPGSENVHAHHAECLHAIQRRWLLGGRDCECVCVVVDVWPSTFAVRTSLALTRAAFVGISCPWPWILSETGQYLSPTQRCWSITITWRWSWLCSRRLRATASRRGLGAAYPRESAAVFTNSRSPPCSSTYISGGSMHWRRSPAPCFVCLLPFVRLHTWIRQRKAAAVRYSHTFSPLGRTAGSTSRCFLRKSGSW